MFVASCSCIIFCLVEFKLMFEFNYLNPFIKKQTKQNPFPLLFCCCGLAAKVRQRPLTELHCLARSPAPSSAPRQTNSAGGPSPRSPAIHLELFCSFAWRPSLSQPVWLPAQQRPASLPFLPRSPTSGGHLSSPTFGRTEPDSSSGRAAPHARAAPRLGPHAKAASPSL
jgi:hypothetical protein